MVFRIGSGAGFSGDRIDAAGPIVAAMAAAGGGGALMFETLGERTLALSQIARRKDPAQGYDPLLPAYLAPILGDAVRAGIVIVGNFGAANPDQAARLFGDMARDAGLGALRIAVVSGDDLLDRFDESAGAIWDGDAGLAAPEVRPIAINVYLGAQAISDAIRDGAQVVVTGRVADPALALGPLVAHYGWDWTDLDRLAAGTLAGHLLECGAQVSGGYFADPGVKDVPGMAQIGFPIAEVDSDGSIVLTKPPGTGGRIDLKTVKEQLLYEIHDPAAYLTPDVTLDITGVRLRELGPDIVRIEGARGHPPPERLKATVSYIDDWLGEAEISYACPNARARAELAIGTIRERLILRGLAPRMRADIIGCQSLFDDDAEALRCAALAEVQDLRVRFAFSASESAPVEAAVQEVGALYCCGPAGGGGVRSSVRERVVTRSQLVPRDVVHARHRRSEGWA